MRYPSIYVEPYPPRFPIQGMRTSEIHFEMYIDDASPSPPGDERDQDGKFIPLVKRRPSVSFDFHADLPVSRSAALTLNSLSGDSTGNQAIPELQLVPAAIPGLELVKAPKQQYSRDKEIYVAMREGEIAQFIRCTGRDQVLNPQCSFRFDVEPIPVKGRVRLANLAEWTKIRENVQSFTECSLAAARASDG